MSRAARTSGKTRSAAYDIDIRPMGDFVALTLRGYNTAMFPLTPGQAEDISRRLADTARSVRRSRVATLKAQGRASGDS